MIHIFKKEPDSVKGARLWFYVLIFHNLKHHPGTQPKAVLEDQTIRDGLILPYTIGVLLEQFFLLVRHGSFELFFIPADQLLQLLYSLEEVSYSVGSILPYQNSSNSFIPHPPRRSFHGG